MKQRIRLIQIKKRVQIIVLMNQIIIKVIHITILEGIKTITVQNLKNLLDGQVLIVKILKKFVYVAVMEYLFQN